MIEGIMGKGHTRRTMAALIETDFPTPERLAKVYGISNSRMKRTKRDVEDAVARLKAEGKIEPSTPQRRHHKKAKA